MKKQILALLGVGTLAYGSANLAFTDLQASFLTPPTNWTYRYDRDINPTFGYDWYFQKNGSGKLFDPLYSKTNDLYAMVISPVIYTDLRQGLQLNVSITGYTASSFWSPSGSLFYPNGNLSTSDGVITTDFYNNTNYDHTIWFDYSTSASGHFAVVQYHSQGLESFNYTFQYDAGTTGINYYVPSNSGIRLQTFVQNTKVFSGLYIRELGISKAYDDGWNTGYDIGYDDGLEDGYDVGYEQGYYVGLENGYPTGFSDGFDAGFSDGVVVAPIGVLFQAAFGAVASIFNIQVLGNLSLGSIIIAPIAVALLWFILGIVSGVGGKKK
jgi:hypothetical protein